MTPEEFRKSRRGFKRNEIEKCLLCGKGLMHNNDLDFYRVTLDRFFFDRGGLMQTHGLETFFQGNVALANVMGADPDIAVAIDDYPHSFLVCGDCSLMKSLPIAAIAERATERDEEREAERNANSLGRDEGPKEATGQPDSD